MSRVADELEAIAGGIREHWQAKYQAREKALANGRDVIRNSANAIRAVHRGELATAEQLLARARALLDETETALRGHADIFYAGFVEDAQKEYAEGSITLALVDGRPLPSNAALNVSAAAYLNGAAEAVGELRRWCWTSYGRGTRSAANRC